MRHFDGVAVVVEATQLRVLSNGAAASSHVLVFDHLPATGGVVDLLTLTVVAVDVGIVAGAIGHERSLVAAAELAAVVDLVVVVEPVATGVVGVGVAAHAAAGVDAVRHESPAAVAVVPDVVPRESPAQVAAALGVGTAVVASPSLSRQVEVQFGPSWP